MFKLPNKFYTTGGGGSSGTTTPTSNKKYEITITQPPEHKPSLDFIRGIPYAAKDNVMFCTGRKFTLEEYKKLDPSAEQVPNAMFIIQDMNHNDIVITSDQIQTFADTPLYMCSDNALKYERLIPVLIAEKTIINGKSVAVLTYRAINKDVFVFKISDVDIWIAAG